LAALRRVAMLVARGEPQEAVFAAVAEEVGQVVPAADLTVIGRYDPGGVVKIAGVWSRTGAPRLIGLRAPLGGRNVHTLVYERQPCARVDHLPDDADAGSDIARELGGLSTAGAPIRVQGRLGAWCSWRPRGISTRSLTGSWSVTSMNAPVSPVARRQQGTCRRRGRADA
jgi:hypothetical protein